MLENYVGISHHLKAIHYVYKHFEIIRTFQFFLNIELFTRIFVKSKLIEMYVLL